MVNNFFEKSSKFDIVTIQFCSNFTSMWSKYLSNVWRVQTSKVNMSNGNIKCPIVKSIFAVNLPLKLFRATVAPADIGSLKSLHTFLLKCLYCMLVKKKTHTVLKPFLLVKKQTVLKPYLTKGSRHLGRRFCSWNNYCLMLINNWKTTIFQCFRNYGSPTRLQVAPSMADPISIKDSDSCLEQ